MEAESARLRIEQLTDKINYYNEQYYLYDKSEISDFEFDKLLKELEELERQYEAYKLPHSPTNRIGGNVTKKFNTVEHRYPMLSLANTYSFEELQEFDKRVQKEIGHNNFDYFCELKFDGVAISLRYINGILTTGVTRGDGVKGDDITDNIKTIRTIPLKINAEQLPEDFEVRGEVFLPKNVFEALNEQREQEGDILYSNPRNTASGTLKLQDSAVVASRKLDCFLYYLLGENLPVDDHDSKINQLEKWGFKVSPTYKKCQNIEEVFEYIKYWANKRYDLAVETDGIVIKVNKKTYQEKLGFTAKNPKWAISYKYKAESAVTLLKSISYQVGRTGAITPVANLEPVQLAGTTVKRASLHNANEIERLDLHVDDYVHVEKGGEIIPKVTGVEISRRTSGAKKIAYIKACPECNTPLIRNAGEAVHYCPNDAYCPPQIIGRIEHFVSKKAMDIDSLGTETITGLIKLQKINNVADLYELKYDDILNLEFEVFSEKKGELVKRRLLEKSVNNILNGIEESKKREFSQVLFALGIRFVGQTVAEVLATHFQNIENLKSAKIEEMLQVQDIGERIADSVYSYFKNPDHLQIIDRLKEHQLIFETKAKEGQSDLLAGSRFVVSGVFETFSRDGIKKSVKENGGKIVSSISNQTDYILAGDNMGPAKLKKAEALGIKIISEEEYLKMVSK